MDSAVRGSTWFDVIGFRRRDGGGDVERNARNTQWRAGEHLCTEGGWRETHGVNRQPDGDHRHYGRQGGWRQGFFRDQYRFWAHQLLRRREGRRNEADAQRRRRTVHARFRGAAREELNATPN